MPASSAPSPPSSPSKRAGLLRQLVTGVQPTDRETHAQRWQRPLLGPRSPSQQKDALPQDQPARAGQRVSALVQGYEASLTANSRRYEALPPGPTSPHKSTFAIDIPARAGPVLGDRQGSSSSSPTSPSQQHSTSPTVPAAFFQRQQYKSAPSDGPIKFAPAPFGKENQPRPQPTRAPSVPRPHFGHSASHASTTQSARSPASSDTFSSGTDVSRVTSALTDLTMATRSSGSTHASSLVTNSAENAYVGVASVVQVQQDTSPRKAAPSRAPQIVETAATPARSALPRSNRPLSAAYVASHPSFQPAPPTLQREQHPGRPDGPVPFERPLLAQRSTSSFVEALPASYPRGAQAPSQYAPLPLDGSPRIGSPEAAALSPQPQQQPRARRNRPRASSLGAALKAPSIEQVKTESAEDKAQRVERDFERLLDTMQLPDRTVRTRMLGLALPLKEEMLRAASSSAHASGTSSSSTLAPPGRPTHSRGRSLNMSASHSSSGSASGTGAAMTKGKKDGGSAGSGFKTFLRKAKSNGSLRGQAASQQPQQQQKDAALAADRPGSRARSRSHSRSASGGLFRSFGRSGGAATAQQASAVGPSSEGENAPYWAERLRSATCAELEAKELGRLRTRLRNEAPAWVDDFIKSGGYLGLLERLKELLDMEWREEQHDDQVLHELLRCFKALTMTACGKRALASHSPTPFLPIAALLFSEKRPGDLPCRQILVELLLSLYDICPPNADALPKSAWADSTISLEPAPLSPAAHSPATFDSGSGGVRRYTRKAKSGDDEACGAVERDEVLTPERVQQAHRFVLSLMRGPPSEEEENKVDFILAARKARLFKMWVKEMADTVRDHFWIFVHSDNLFWTLEQIDADEIEAPKVPSGMTGGVEQEAMTYCATHFRLINAVARACPTPEDAFNFHEQLFLSGFERVIFTLRRASRTYYETLHLEMSRYVSLARAARFNLGPRLLACLDRRVLSAEERLVLQQAEERRGGGGGADRARYTSHKDAPQIGDIF